jgi:pimeloyl-ACP methyl ester carboxylesterase
MILRDNSPAATFVLVHGAWNTGANFEEVADILRSAGHMVYCPTLCGNQVGDDRRNSGLEEAISSITEYLEINYLNNVCLVGHGYGGMVISGVADCLEKKLRRLVYINAYVPLDGQGVTHMSPDSLAAACAAIAEEAISLGTAAAGIIGAAGIQILGGRYLGYIGAVFVATSMIVSELSALRIARLSAQAAEIDFERSACVYRDP